VNASPDARTLGWRGLRVRPRAGIAFLKPGDLVFLTDVWVLLFVLWATRALAGHLDPAAGAFGLAAFVLAVLPGMSRETTVRPTALDDAGRLCRALWLAYAAVVASDAVIGLGSEQTLLGVTVAATMAMSAGRGLSHTLERHWVRHRTRSKTLVLGGGRIAQRLVRALSQHPEYGLEIVGAVDDDPIFDSAELGTKVIGGVEEAPRLIREYGVKVVFVAFSSSDHANMVSIIRAAMANGAIVWTIPRFFEMGLVTAQADHVWGLPVVRVQRPARNRPQWALKRSLDYFLAALATLALSPVMAVISLLIVVESGRPVLLRQRRVGLDGRSFDMLKFRSMRPADQDVESTEWRADGERVTRVGRVLRRSSLDELPQFLNVIKGEMSLVGPRPERPYFVERFSDLYPYYGARHRLPAGVTGWAQIHGLRGDTSIEERVTFDNYYIENWSLTLDFKILLRTIFKLVVG
jgi:exopolysaccharide biosynthesis polyprenyl glycosylphosphotransferase